MQKREGGRRCSPFVLANEREKGRQDRTNRPKEKEQTAEGVREARAIFRLGLEKGELSQ